MSSIEIFVKISIELSILTFAISLLICLVRQVWRKRDGYDTGFFRVFIVCAICDCICNYIVCFVCHFPNTGVFQEFFEQQAREDSTFLCTYIYPIAGFGSRVSFIGQMFIAANRFTAIYFPMKHQEIWKPRNTNLIVGVNFFLGFLLQSPSIFTQGKYVTGYNCAYGMAFGKISVQELNRYSQSATTCISGLTCLILSISSVTKLNSLFRHGTVSVQNRKDIPLLIYSLILTIEMVIMGFCYAINQNFNVSGGDNPFLVIYSWAIFFYLLSPATLLFLTSKNVRNVYFDFYLPRRLNEKWRGSSTIISLATTTH